MARYVSLLPNDHRSVGATETTVVGIVTRDGTGTVRTYSGSPERLTVLNSAIAAQTELWPFRYPGTWIFEESEGTVVRLRFLNPTKPEIGREQELQSELDAWVAANP